MGLRETLRTSLRQPNSSMALTRQLAIALSDLLLQLPEWTNAIHEMVEQLGSDATTVSALLEFLTVLPEEAAQNGRLDVTVRRISHLFGRTD